MKRSYRLFLGSAVFLVVLAFFVRVLNISSSADETCRHLMMGASGYGPWHPLKLPADEQADNHLFTTAGRIYSDGVNTAWCNPQQLGLMWYVINSSQTSVGFNFGLESCGSLPYPRKAYGVFSTEPKSQEEIRREFFIFADKIFDEVCQKPSLVP
jgi:hypothetical protein